MTQIILYRQNNYICVIEMPDHVNISLKLHQGLVANYTLGHS